MLLLPIVCRKLREGVEGGRRRERERERERERGGGGRKIKRLKERWREK